MNMFQKAAWAESLFSTEDKNSGSFGFKFRSRPFNALFYWCCAGSTDICSYMYPYYMSSEQFERSISFKVNDLT